MNCKIPNTVNKLLLLNCHTMLFVVVVVVFPALSSILTIQITEDFQISLVSLTYTSWHFSMIKSNVKHNNMKIQWNLSCETTLKIKHKWSHKSRGT